MNLKKSLLIVFGLFAFSETASAERWIQKPDDEWSWIDLDSIHSDSQGYVHYTYHMGKDPRGPVDKMFNYSEELAMDCKSRKNYSFAVKKWYDRVSEWTLSQVCGAQH